MPHEHIQPREIDDTDFIISGLLGEGGSKTVFDAIINGKEGRWRYRIVLTIPIHRQRNGTVYYKNPKTRNYYLN
ncbi:hypothetical protein FBF26_02995 [Candidatus Saccharibacteria bacterium oral taxon 488]|nr:hypothetical protein FBF26_02995 [Candidatus Saccharibacteria bacterium oral taxon 488]